MTTLRSSNVIRTSEYTDGTIGKLPRLLGRVSLPECSSSSLPPSLVEDTDKGNVDRRNEESKILTVYVVRGKLSRFIECIFQKEENAIECCNEMNTTAIDENETFEVATVETED